METSLDQAKTLINKAVSLVPNHKHEIALYCFWRAWIYDQPETTTDELMNTLFQIIEGLEDMTQKGIQKN
jgi:hypothetical protein